MPWRTPTDHARWRLTFMADEPRTTDVLDKIKAMQQRAGASGKHGYSSVLAEAADEIEQLRAVLRHVAVVPDAALGHEEVARDMRRLARERFL